ncbi:endonuclease/exonuclease/phosphatase family protein [Citromicrobium bathyomarinum]|uniref:endonuclease/exonuclease/phosphatase family protein n=1 Tax=Citromicrobium bathyomarinum TaxID=72174 RepID=UPI003159B793
MAIYVAWFNVEKVGRSSPREKEIITNHFLDYCFRSEFDIVTLLEIHSARETDIASYINSVYGPAYSATVVHGGHSNSYVCAIRTRTTTFDGSVKLVGLNRDVAEFSTSASGGFKLKTYLAHFKSGQTGLTAKQLREAVDAAAKNSGGTWMIGGDLNWEYDRREALGLPGDVKFFSYWSDSSQRKGGILDWALYSDNLKIKAAGISEFKRKHSEFGDMSGPDHKPVALQIDNGA